MKRIVLTLLTLTVAIGLVLVVARFLGLDSSVHSEKFSVVISNIFMAKKVTFKDRVIQSVDPAADFAPTDREINVCFILTASRPISITYLWYHESNLVRKDTALVESGLNCAGIHANNLQPLLAPGRYYVFFSFEGIITDARAEFSVVSKTG